MRRQNWKKHSVLGVEAGWVYHLTKMILLWVLNFNFMFRTTKFLWFRRFRVSCLVHARNWILWLSSVACLFSIKGYQVWEGWSNNTESPDSAIV